MYIAAMEEEGFTFVPDWMISVPTKLRVVEDFVFV
jgi:hypothetical protein